MTLPALVGFLIFALIVLVIAYAVIKVVALIPSLPPPAGAIVPLIVGVIALIAILYRAAAVFGIPL